MTGSLGRVCVQLIEGGWPDAVHSLLGAQPEEVRTNPHIERATRLLGLARRVLGLDAEDFMALAAEFGSHGWHRDLVAAGFPANPRDPKRGALESLVPLFELMLETGRARLRRGDTQSVVVLLHLMAEYVCQLAWESTLGHAGDPLRMRSFVGERWGTPDTKCPHSSALRATARRSLHACSGDQAGYVGYLDRYHSRLGEALAQCAMNHETIEAGERPDVGPTCPNPCRWVLSIGDLAYRRELDGRLRLALGFLDSPVVALRHHAPVGHFFGVPSVAEVTEAWQRTWERLAQQWPDEANPLAGRRQDENDEALPGLAVLISTIAGHPVRGGTLLHRITRDAIAELDAAGY